LTEVIFPFHVTHATLLTTAVGFSLGSTITLENCSILRKLKTKRPYHNTLAYINDQARLIRTITSPFLDTIVFLGKWDESQMGRAVTDWLEPARWEIVDEELFNLVGRLEDGVKLQVIFADGALSGRGGFEFEGCEEPGGIYASLLNGARARGAIVKVQKEEEFEPYE
jgi:hypothetical protein